MRDQLIDSTTNAPVDIAAYSYDAVGNLATLTRGNGVVATYDYDALNRLSDITNKRAGSTLSHFHYDVRADGKRTKLDESMVNADAGRVSTRSVGYGYDAAGKLTDEVGQDGRGVGFSSHWDYDGVGNRVGRVRPSIRSVIPDTSWIAMGATTCGRASNGRFLSHDPLMGSDEDPISMHRHLYAGFMQALTGLIS